MNAYAVLIGAALLLVAAVLVRFRDGIARWRIEARVEVLRRSSLQNSEYLQREIDSLETPGSQQLTRLLVVLLAILLAGIGVLEIVKGLALA